MRILFDTNVLVDAVVEERPYHEEAVFLINQVEKGHLSGVITPLSVGTLWYLGTTHYNVDPRPLLQALTDIMDFAPMGRAILKRALTYSMDTDLEDMYVAEAGKAGGVSAVVTRNERDFGPVDLTVYHPAELSALL